MAKPKNPGEVLDRIGNELKLLWALLDVYQELYVVEQDKRATLLGQTAPGFFAIIQAALTESILMRAFRLMDKGSMGDGANCSFETLRKLLARQSPIERRDQAVYRLRKCLVELRRDWRRPGSIYADLKKIRNKELAHNDYTRHYRRDTGQLWLTLSVADFDLARSLGCRLWHLYRQAKVAICGVDVLEPKLTRLDDRPSMLLKHLCSSLFLDHLMGDECYQYADSQNAFELQHMGEDRVRHVFSDGRGRS